MQGKLFLSYILIILIIIGCISNPEQEFEKDKNFPKVKNLTTYKQTIFLPTLETTFNTKINGILRCNSALKS